MKKTPEQIQEERVEIDRLVATLSTMVNRVPASHNSWSYQRAVEFKEAAKKARSEINRARRSVLALLSAYAQLSIFYAAA